MNPIAAAAARPSRAASGALSAVAYGVIGLDIVLASRQLARPHRPAGEVTRTVNLVFEDPTPAFQGGGGGRGGSGTIDPQLKAQAEEEQKLSELQSLEPVPLDLPREDRSLEVPLDPQLPQVPGGDGLGRGEAGGQGAGSGNGSGGGHGSGQGSGMFRTANGVGIALPVKDLVRVHQVLPDYPKAAKRMFVEGDVVVRMTIDEKGTPIAVEIVSGHELLRADTLQAAWQWRFEPVQYEGHPVQATFELVFRYSLVRV